MNLEEFDQANGGRRDTQWLTQQQEWDAIVAGYQKGIRPDTIRLWLIKECGYSDKVLPSADAIRRHLRTYYNRDGE